ncbi:MAG: hypothetical protein K6U04_09345 [Armatimonadetes bacterium]|nr:hypothetical protein [Armatimonadota bacterium]
MNREKRLRVIQKIARLRESALLCYVTGDRENVNTRIAPDVTPFFYRHLEMIGKRKRIDLFLYTRGGDILTPWRLVHLIREYADEFNVLVPFRAYSAGTLICLGADEIIMGKMGELGPIDPSVVNAFNPQDPANPAARIPVNIEDVYSYLTLARDEAGLRNEADLSKAFLLLAERIHPLALGNVHRNYLLIRSLAKKLLGLRKNCSDPDEVGRIVDHLTEKLYAHNHMISRREAAEEIGLPVVYPARELERLLWELYQYYVEELSLDEPFSPAQLLKGARTEFTVAGGLVESEYGQDAFLFSGVVERRDFPDAGQICVNILKQGWKTVI